jgi:hypothetical protein
MHADPRWALVERVSSSSTFEKCYRLRTFFLHVCRAALENRPEATTEQQIGIHVFGKPPGYNPNEDNIVRSQARLLRLKLEHHFSNEGQDEPVIVKIPKGQYLPVFEPRPIAAPQVSPAPPVVVEHNTWPHPQRLLTILAVAAGLLALATIWLGIRVFGSNAPATSSGIGLLHGQDLSSAANVPGAQQPVAAAAFDEIRIAAGSTATYVDARGRRWEADRYFTGGVSTAGPKDFFPPIADPALFRTVRESASSDADAPEAQREFRYDIPVKPGVYELALYFADPIARVEGQTFEDGQNRRHFFVNLNGQSILSYFDPVADAGPASLDVRTFKDVVPADDGKVHLQFVAGLQPSFLSALELTPGAAGQIKPIRICARKSDFVDGDGVRWSGDRYFIGGRRGVHSVPPGGPGLPPVYLEERYGSFSYAIPVPSGRYTLTLHFAESFYSSGTASLGCRGTGCRVFDVSCNGVALLRDFDIFQSAGGAFRPISRSFHGLTPNGQGKLLVSFSPRVDYAEIRAIEVADEAAERRPTR